MNGATAEPSGQESGAPLSEIDSYNAPKPGKTYISPSLASFSKPTRKVRIATKLIEHPVTYAFAQVKEELVLRHHEGAETCITAKFFEDDRGIFVLSIHQNQG